MTNVFTNKKTKRYYYYKCVKVAKEGKNACSIKEVNSEKIESFIFENLERISQDKNYVESLAFKILRNSPLPLGNELSGESEKNYSERVLHVLQRYASDYKNGTQIERALVTKRTIERIIVSKDCLEVIVSLIDRTELKLGDVLSARLSGSAHSLREGVVNPAAPAYIGSSNEKLVTLGSKLRTSLDYFSVVLSHKLFDRSHALKGIRTH
jgi:hypothetical protein